jgi:hypothetical protein
MNDEDLFKKFQDEANKLAVLSNKNNAVSLQAENVILQDELKVLKNRYEIALKVLQQIADRPRKTQERNMANAVVNFLKLT